MRLAENSKTTGSSRLILHNGYGRTPCMSELQDQKSVTESWESSLMSLTPLYTDAHLRRAEFLSGWALPFTAHRRCLGRPHFQCRNCWQTPGFHHFLGLKSVMPAGWKIYLILYWLKAGCKERPALSADVREEQCSASPCRLLAGPAWLRGYTWNGFGDSRQILSSNLIYTATKLIGHQRYERITKYSTWIIFSRCLTG